MTSLEIQYQLKFKKITQKSIAEKIGVSEMTISKVINRIIISDRVMKVISTEIGEDYRLVFGDYYLRPAKRATSKVASV